MFYRPCYWVPQRSSNTGIPRLGGFWGKPHMTSALSLSIDFVSLGGVVWICVPTVWEREPADLDLLSQRATKSYSGLPRAKRTMNWSIHVNCLMGSSVVMLSQATSSLTGPPPALAVTTSQWSTAIYVSSHCASLHLCSPCAHLLRAAHLHIYWRGGCI